MKKWLLLSLVGIVFISAPMVYFWRAARFQLAAGPALVIGIIGVFLLLTAYWQSMLSIIPYLKNPGDADQGTTDSHHLAQLVYHRQVRSKGRKIVVVGGGTGLSVLLRGLKQVTRNISAVVTVADDGGGSGVLREDLGMLPPGDIRSCLLALAETEPTMEALLQYRFTEGKLKGQSFGNLFIASMNGISDSFEEAVKKMGEVLAVEGHVYPVTLEDITLFAQLKSGQVIKGESNIPIKSIEEASPIDFVFIRPRNPAALPEVLSAIHEADAIILGPGSLYTSIIPNLLVPEVANQINQSNACKIYLSNIMTQPGETDYYSVSDHVKALMSNSGLAHLDVVLANTQTVPDTIAAKYREEGAEMVIPTADDRQFFRTAGIHLMCVEAVEVKNNYVRHDALKISRLIHNHLLGNKMKRTNIQQPL